MGLSSSAAAVTSATEPTGRLLAWFGARTRDVPWRGETDPYRIWVAETMAQQTRIETVRPYYEEFLRRFPTVAALAAAPEDRVLEAWKGLGYYARARRLRTAAREICERFGGVLPDSVPELRSLPGIGRYTAGAVASLAFGRPEPAVDGNARRVLARLFDLEETAPRVLDDAARRLIAASPRRAAQVNQALMDLGSEICTPRRPRCPRCPLTGMCLARRRRTIDRRPGAVSRPAPPWRYAAAAILRSTAGGRDRVLLFRRPVDGLLGGLWDFPGTRPVPTAPRDAGAGLRRTLERDFGVRPARLSETGQIDHGFSHFRLRLRFFEAPVPSGEPPHVARRDGGPLRWADPLELAGLATPAYLRSTIARLAGERKG